MPPRGSRSKKATARKRQATVTSNTATPSQTVASCKHDDCDVCCSPIIDGKEEALMCEGSCQKWFHRYCAGVSASCYRILSSSSTPFVCWMCSQKLHSTVVGQLQAEISALREEVLELRNSTAPSKWTTVVSRRTHAANVSQPSPQERNLPPSSTKPSCSATQHNASQRTRSSHRRNAVRVEGKRKVWGTWPTTTSAVKSSIGAVTSVENLMVKRKYKTFSRTDGGNPVRKTKWWFVISGNEESLQQLQEKWSAVKSQTGWTLEPVFIYDEAHQPPQTMQQANELSTPISQQARNGHDAMEANRSLHSLPSNAGTPEATKEDALESSQSALLNNSSASESSQN